MPSEHMGHLGPVKPVLGRGRRVSEGGLVGDEGSRGAVLEELVNGVFDPSVRNNMK